MGYNQDEIIYEILYLGVTSNYQERDALECDKIFEGYDKVDYSEGQK